jgi:hypothetical protein
MKKIIGLFLFVQLSVAQDFPKPPSGFEWVKA